MGLVSYYMYGLPTFIVIVIALYLLFTGKCSPSLRFAAGFTDMTVQVRVKLSMSVGSSKRRVLMRGLPLGLGCASVSVFLVPDGTPGSLL